MNKRGFLRIVEATIAIFIIAGVLFLFFTRGAVSEEPDLSERARNILDEVSKDFGLREDVLAENGGDVEAFISTRIPENYLDFEVRICEVDGACGIEFKDTTVWSAERIISSTINTPGPKKVRLFIWEKEL